MFVKYPQQSNVIKMFIKRRRFTPLKIIIKNTQYFMKSNNCENYSML